MLNVAIYISNHGFGHATRMSALAEQLISVGIRCHIVANRPFSVFSHLNPQYCSYRQKKIDFGIVQNDWLSADLSATAKELYNLYRDRDVIVAEEELFCREQRIQFIISDIAFLPFLVARKIGIRACGVSNFDWYYIYSRIFKTLPETFPADLKKVLPKLLAWVSFCYEQADFGLRLPFSDKESLGAFKLSFSTHLLAAKVLPQPDILRRDFYLNKDVEIVLLALKEREWDGDELTSLCETGRYILCKQQGFIHPNYRIIPEEYPFSRVLRGAEIIITKTGYSTLAEAVQYGKKIVFTDRKVFPEDKVLVQGLKRYSGSHYLDPDLIKNADWSQILDSLSRSVAKPIPNNNRKVAFELINKLFGGASERRVAVIDVGTNNVLLLWYDLVESEVVHRASRISAMGKNLKERLLTDAGIKRVKKILKDFIDFSQSFTSNIIVTGTSCSRESLNITLLAEWLQKKYGICYRILTEDEEAEMAGLANREDFREHDELILFDIGGGSTEFICFKGDKILFKRSLPLGIRRLENCRLSETDRRTAIRQLLQQIPHRILKNPVLVGIGGTVTNISAVKKGLYHYDSSKVHKSVLTATEIKGYHKRFVTLTTDQIAELMPFEPMRADVITIGLTIVDEVLKHFEAEEFFVSDRGIQFGVLERIKGNKW